MGRKERGKDEGERDQGGERGGEGEGNEEGCLINYYYLKRHTQTNGETSSCLDLCVGRIAQINILNNINNNNNNTTFYFMAPFKNSQGRLTVQTSKIQFYFLIVSNYSSKSPDKITRITI